MADDGFKIASAYVTVSAQVDQATAEAAGREIGEAASESAGKVKIKAEADETSAAEAGAEVGETASKAAEEKSKDGGSSAGSLLAAGIAAAAPVAGAAILAGVGAAVIGAGALIEKNNAQLQSAADTLLTGVENEGRQVTSTLTGPLTSAITDLNADAERAKPQLDSLFSGVAGDIPILTTGIGDMVSNLLPGLDNAVNNSASVTFGLATMLGQLGKSGGDFLTTLSQDSQQYGAVLQSLGSIADTALGTVANATNNVAQVWASSGVSVDASVKELGSDITSLAKNATPELSSGLNALATTADGALHALSPFTPLLGAIGGEALTAYSSFKLFSFAGQGVQSLGKAISGASDNARQFTVSATGSAEAGATVGTAFEKAGGAIVSAGKALPIVGAGVTLVTQGFESLVGTQGEYLGQLESGQTLSQDQTAQLRMNTDAVNSLSFGNSTLKSILSSIIPTQDSVNDALNQYLNTLSPVQKAQIDATTAQTQYNEAVSQYGKESPQAHDALQTYQGDLGAVNNLLDQQNQDLLDNTQIREQNIANLLTMVQADTQQTASLNQVNSAQNNYADAVKKSGVNSLTAKQSLDSLNSAQINFVQQAGQAAQANDQNASSAEKAADQATGEAGAILGLAAASNGHLTPALQQMVAGLGQSEIAAYQSTTAIDGTHQAVVTLPDGKVIHINVDSNGVAVANQTQQAINSVQGKAVQLIVNEVINPVKSGSGGSVYVPFALPHGDGGIFPRLHAPGDVLTPAPAVAQFAPPNSWLDIGGRGTDVVGDRSDVDEAYIPLDGSSRSKSILAEATRRMPGAAVHADGALSPALSAPITNIWQISPQVKTDNPHELATKVATEVQWKMMQTVGG